MRAVIVGRRDPANWAGNHTGLERVEREPVIRDARLIVDHAVNERRRREAEQRDKREAASSSWRGSRLSVQPASTAGRDGAGRREGEKENGDERESRIEAVKQTPTFDPLFPPPTLPINQPGLALSSPSSRTEQPRTSSARPPFPPHPIHPIPPTPYHSTHHQALPLLPIPITILLPTPPSPSSPSTALPIPREIRFLILPVGVVVAVIVLLCSFLQGGKCVGLLERVEGDGRREGGGRRGGEEEAQR